MKLIHTADWHLGNTFHGHNREVEHRHFFDWLLAMLRAEQPDALLVSGDVFDSSNPSAAAERLFYEFLGRAEQAVPGLQVVVTAGNHDSGGRLEAPAELLRAHNVYVRGTLRRIADDSEAEPDYDHYILPLCRRDDAGHEARVVVLAVPYLRSGDYAAGATQEEGLATFFDRLHRHLRKSPFKGLPVVACAHFYANGAEISISEHSERLVVGGQDRVRAEIAEKEAAYVALGHIHKQQQAGRRTWYAGAPVPMSFSEKQYPTGVLAIDLDEEGEAVVRRIGYAPLRPLVSIPAKGAAAPTEVVRLVGALARRPKNDEGDNWPYLEIRVCESQPEPKLLHDVTEALQDKAVHFCRMVRETAGGKNGEEGDSSVPRPLHRIAPDELACRIFRAQYKEEMPLPLLERFREAAAEQENIDENASAKKCPRIGQQ